MTDQDEINATETNNRTFSTDLNRDYFLYNGSIERSAVLPFLELVSEEAKFDDVTLLLVTHGGDPDAAYKIARYLQDKYENFTVCLPGFCKSAGTLLATAASELSFAPYGELGPLDIQMSKRDDLMGLESGLNITEAFYSLSDHARQTYNELIMDILRSSGGVISFQTASHAAAEIISGTFGPVFGQIEPDEVGSRARAMRIGYEYAQRLNLKYGNLQPTGVNQLCQTYPSHGFVIDKMEAKRLFYRVRSVDVPEIAAIEGLGDVARHQGTGLDIRYLNELIEDIYSGVLDNVEDEAAKPGAAGKGIETVDGSAEQAEPAPARNDKNSKKDKSDKRPASG